MNKIIFLSVLWLLSAFLFISCSPRSSPKEKLGTGETLIQKRDDLSKAAWELEWEQLLENARKEGKLLVMSTADPEVREATRKGFKDKTGIEVEAIAGRGSELSAKLFAERRAGLYLVDVYVGGSQTSITTLKPAAVLAPLKPLLFLPEVLDPQVWVGRELPWLDNERNLIFGFLSFPADTREIGYNTNFIKKSDVSSLHDLLNPKFKGKMNMQDPTSPGKGGKWFYSALKLYKGIDIDFMKALARQEPLITRDKRLQVEWLTRGKNIVALLPDNTTIKEFIRLDAPIDYLSPIEARPRLATGSGSLALMRNAPHPYAAKLFVNWLLTREGQTIYTKSYNTQSSRVDVPTDFLPADELREPNVEYFMETEDFLIETAKMLAVSNEIFGPLLR